MKMKTLMLIMLASLACMSYAQPPEFPNEEALETLRFIRMAETKKALDFLSEEQLLDLNALLDEHEKERITIRRKEFKAVQRVRQGNLDEAEAGQILDQLVALRKQMHDGEMKLHQDVRAMLNNAESLAFFTFYEEFQRKIRRRISMLRNAGENLPLSGQGRPGRFRN